MFKKNFVARGKDLGVYTPSTIGDALNSWINGGNFGDVYVGDYFTMAFPVASGTSVAAGTSRNIKFRIAGFNLFLHTGSTELTTPHIVIVPDQFLQTGSRMHSSNDCASTGFAGTELFTTIIGGESITGTNTINKKLSTLFGSHLISHEEYLSSTAYPGYSGHSEYSDVVSSYAPKTVYANIMNAKNLCGLTFSNSIYEISVYNGQFPLFRLMPEYSVGVYYDSSNGTEAKGCTLLRDIIYATSSYTCFGACDNNGLLSYSNAGSYVIIRGVRPYFLLG